MVDVLHLWVGWHSYDRENRNTCTSSRGNSVSCRTSSAMVGLSQWKTSQTASPLKRCGLTSRGTNQTQAPNSSLLPLHFYTKPPLLLRSAQSYRHTRVVHLYSVTCGSPITVFSVFSCALFSRYCFAVVGPTLLVVFVYLLCVSWRLVLLCEYPRVCIVHPTSISVYLLGLAL